MRMATLDVKDIRFEKVAQTKEKTPEDKLGFGAVYTDHMLLIDWDDQEGWHDPRIVPYGPFSLDPATAVFHYGQAIFEGMKAYNENGKILLFRPDCNFERLNISADRLSLPALDPEFALASLKKLLEIEKSWVPSSAGTSLYIRPFMFSTEKTLAVHTAKTVTYGVILSPSGAYFSSDLAPTKIYVEEEYVRAVRGGMGYAKTAGNYAGSYKGQDKAAALGYAQTLWLDGVERKYIEEVGAMNIFFKINGTYVTPALNGSILPGITRRSVIQLLEEAGETVEERHVSIEELLEGIEDGSVEEIFGTGTAAVVTPVGELAYRDKKYVVNDFKTGPGARNIYDRLTAIQLGKEEGPQGWSVEVCKV